MANVKPTRKSSFFKVSNSWLSRRLNIDLALALLMAWLMHMTMSSTHSFCLTPRWQFTVVTSKPSSGAITCESPAPGCADDFAFAFALAFGGAEDDDVALRFLETLFVVPEQITLPDMLVNKRLTNCFFASESKIQPEVCSSSVSSGTFSVHADMTSAKQWWWQMTDWWMMRDKGKSKQTLTIGWWW